MVVNAHMPRDLERRHPDGRADGPPALQVSIRWL